MDRLRRLIQACLRYSITVRGQFTGAAMIMLPALTHAVPLSAGPGVTVQILAVIVGFGGILIVFGGLLRRIFLQATTTQTPTTTLAPTTTQATLDDVLLAVPHPRAVWLSLALLCLGLLIGTAWCLMLVFTRDWKTHLPEAMMFALPAVALGWAAWRARVMTMAPSPS